MTKLEEAIAGAQAAIANWVKPDDWHVIIESVGILNASPRSAYVVDGRHSEDGGKTWTPWAIRDNPADVAYLFPDGIPPLDQWEDCKTLEARWLAEKAAKAEAEREPKGDEK